MTTYTGNEHVTPGMYLNLRRRNITHLETAGTLPGTPRDRFYRVPILLMLAAAPLAGLIFVIFLPLIGFVMAGRLLGDTLLYAIGPAIAAAVRVVRPGWVPTMAFFTRAKPQRRNRVADTKDDEWAEATKRALQDRDDHR